MWPALVYRRCLFFIMNRYEHSLYFDKSRSRPMMFVTVFLYICSCAGFQSVRVNVLCVHVDVLQSDGNFCVQVFAPSNFLFHRCVVLVMSPRVNWLQNKSVLCSCDLEQTVTLVWTIKKMYILWTFWLKWVLSEAGCQGNKKIKWWITSHYQFRARLKLLPKYMEQSFLNLLFTIV